MEVKRLSYSVFIYVIATGYIQQITNTSNPNGFPALPDTLAYKYTSFLNYDLLKCYYDPQTDKYYEDEAKTIEIIDPANYVKPEDEIPEGEPLYTLDEAITQKGEK